MSYQEAYQEPYTKYPNRYNDVIKPLLTDTQRDVCDVVIRMTYGWHRTSAVIPNSVFAEKASKSIQGIIKAKKQLEDIGLLVVLERGGGSKKGEYMLDLWYDNPDKSVKASILQQEDLLSEEQEETSDLLENSTTDEPTISEKLQPELEESIEEAENQFLAESLDEELPARDTIGKSESNTPEEPVSDPDYPILQSEISDPEAASNPSKMEGFETSTTKLSLPPSIEGNINNIYNLDFLTFWSTDHLKQVFINIRIR